ncbi:MAG TPA: L-ribulose-5-phosphate 4-epimerase AraD [Candidatus Hydrogenedentes bacterium]|nr:L-ribulose-5-phosphate 4-epimerase AraD [Candidatus Hydrogenedentota bacterium]
MLDDLKHRVFEANRALVAEGLVLLTWGNASAIDRASGRIVIKPSGAPYDQLRPEDMTVVDLEGNPVEGPYRPSVDMPTHLELYRAWPEVGGVVHTHSHYATVWAQACRPIPCLGTTHADLAYGTVPVTDSLTGDEVARDYEHNIGKVIVRRYTHLKPMQCPVVLAANHGPFAWGTTIEDAVRNAVALEEVARMAFDTLLLSRDQPAIAQHLLDKHFLRKHGPQAYYGQPS